MKVFDIACTGTSLTNGPSGLWRTRLESLLSISAPGQVASYDVAYSGQTSAYGLTQIGRLVGLRPRVALIEFIMNDAYTVTHPDFPAYTPPGFSVAQSEQNTRDIIAAIRTGSPGTAIYLMTMNPAIGTWAPTRPDMTAYNGMYQSVARSLGVGFIDNYPLWAGATLSDIPDGVHPYGNVAADKIAAGIAATLAPLL